MYRSCAEEPATARVLREGREKPFKGAFCRECGGALYPGETAFRWYSGGGSGLICGDCLVERFSVLSAGELAALVGAEPVEIENISGGIVRFW